MGHFRYTIVAFGTLLWLAALLPAQDPPDQRLSLPDRLLVAVIDAETLKPIEGAKITLRIPANRDAKTGIPTAMTDARGEHLYIFASAPLGTYLVCLEHADYRSAEEKVNLKPMGNSQRVVFKLVPKSSEGPDTYWLARWNHRTHVSVSDRNQEAEELQAVEVKISKFVPGMTEKEIKDKEEEERGIYAFYPNPSPLVDFRRADNNDLLKPKGGLLPGYSIGDNKATHRAMCSGTAMGYLFRKPTRISADAAWVIVSTFGEKVTYGQAEVGDIVIWKRNDQEWNAKGAQHFTWVSYVAPGTGTVVIHTKSDNGLVWNGPLLKLPLPQQYDKEYAIYRIDFDSIDLFRPESMRLASVPPATGKVIEKDLAATDPRWPWPWIKRAVIETCNDITRALKLPDYELTFDGKHGICEAKWERINKDGPGTDSYVLRLSGPWTRAHARELQRTWLRINGQFPPRPGITPITLAGFPAERVEPVVSLSGSTSEYRWAHRAYFCSVVASDGTKPPALRINRKPWYSDQELVKKLKKEALDRNTTNVDKMRDLFLARLKQYGLDLPVRNDVPLDYTSGPIR